MNTRDTTFILALSLALLSPQSARAQAPAGTTSQNGTETGKAKDDAANKASTKSELSVIKGPAKIALGDNVASIDLPAQYVFVKKDKAATFLKKTGGVPKGLIGILAPVLAKEAKDSESFIVVCSFDDMGYVNDDDAAKLDANAILNTYKEGTAQENEELKEQGMPPIYVGGWAEVPRYEKSKHQVIWAIEVKDQDSPKAPVVTINYNTRILGRHGVLSLNLVTDPATLATNKVKTTTLLNQTAFVKGSSYEEYQPGKDKSSGLGLTGLILGGGALAAAAKFGVLGGLWKWAIGLLLVAKKFIIIIIAAGAAAVSKFFRGRKGAGKIDQPPTPPTDGT